jgi:hypothetical protein
MTDRHKKYVIIAMILGAITFGAYAYGFLYLHENWGFCLGV